MTDAGKVGGFGTVLKVSGSTLGATATTYASGDLIGGKLTLTPVSRSAKDVASLVSVTVHDLDAQEAALDILLFDTNPSNTTFTDDAALDVDDADLPNVVGIVNVAAADYVSLSDNSVAHVENLSILLKPASGDTVYAAVVSGGTPTYTANGLSVNFAFLQG